jgi:tetratricopeptide (TPR) repeat protein
VSIYRTAADSKDPRAQAYVPTAYERAVDYYHRGSIDSALALVNSHSVLLQQSKSAGLLYSRLLIQTRAYDKAAGLLMTLADRYPTDFNVLIECGHFLQQVALATNNQPLLVRAQHYYERATIVNPYKAGYANTLYGQTLRQMTGQTSP